jgi:protoporphyrinogen oxidase
MLKGISVPTYFVFAMTMRNAMRYWIRYPDPMYRILRGNLQQLSIDPIRRKLEELGCDIRTSVRLERMGVEGLRIFRLSFVNEEAQCRHDVEVDNVVMAIPAEKLAALIDDVYAASPSLVFTLYYAQTAKSSNVLRKYQGDRT